jgi:hypothetical protein
MTPKILRPYIHHVGYNLDAYQRRYPGTDDGPHVFYYSSEQAWGIPRIGDGALYPTAEEAMKVLDAHLIKEDFILCDSEEQVQQYLLLQ